MLRGGKSCCVRVLHRNSDQHLASVVELAVPLGPLPGSFEFVIALTGANAYRHTQIF